MHRQDAHVATATLEDVEANAKSNRETKKGQLEGQAVFFDENLVGQVFNLSLHVAESLRDSDVSERLTNVEGSTEQLHDGQVENLSYKRPMRSDYEKTADTRCARRLILASVA